MPAQSSNSIRPHWKQVIVSLFVAIYIAINIFQLGGDAFVISLNGFLVIPLALAVTVLSYRLWRQMKPGTQNQLLWLGLAIGWGMWTVAELWWAVSNWTGQELPYPSWADFFWLVGYLPLYYALNKRISSLPKNTAPGRKISIWGVTLAIVGFATIFIFVPIIQASDPSTIVENIINVSYPLADLIILILVIQLWFSYQQGVYGRIWQWFTIGFILVSLSDLLYAYAALGDLYYPEQQVNLLSTIGIDIPYNLSYLVWVIALVLLQELLNNYQPVIRDNIKLELVPNTHLLVFIGADNRVLENGVSHNYTGMFPEIEVKGKTIQEALGISSEDASAILDDIKANKVLKERRFHANTRWGQEQIGISGMAIFNPQGEHSGVYLLARILGNDYTLDRLLTVNETAMMHSILKQTGTDQKERAEIKQLLEDYYQMFFHAFYNRAIAEGGSIFADAFITELQFVVSERGWKIEIQPTSLVDSSRLSLSEARETLPLLFETAKQFIGKLTDEESANDLVRDVRSTFEKTALNNISHFEYIKTEQA